MMRNGWLAGALATAAALSLGAQAQAKGDLTKQAPIMVEVMMGESDGAHTFSPRDLSFETGVLYQLVLLNPSKSKHYFTSHGLAKSVFTRKVQVVDDQGVTVEVKGSISEIEVYPGGRAEWWFVPVASGSFSDLHCHIKEPDGRNHADLGMIGTIEIK